MRRSIEKLEDDKDKVENFLINNDNQLAVPISQYPWWIKGTIDLFFEKWKIIIAERSNEIIWLLWITFWEPSKNYENPEIWYLYLLMFDEKNRRKKDMIIWFFKILLEEMKNKWIKTIRFKADATVEYTNWLYKKFANFVCCQKNTQWIDCNLYEADIDQLYNSFFVKSNFRPLLEKTSK